MFIRIKTLALAGLLILLVSCSSASQVSPTESVQAVSTLSTLTSSTKPPAATLEVNGKIQTAGIGTYCWSSGGLTSQHICADMSGIPTARQPLIAENTPYTAIFHLPLDTPPSSLYVSVMSATEEQLGNFGDARVWGPISGWSGSLPLKKDVEYTFQESPGLYILELNAAWKDQGDVTYGFLVQVGDVSSSSIKISGTSAPTPAPVILKTITPLTRLGKGNIQALVVSNDGRWMAVGTSMGVYLYEIADQHQIWFQTFDSKLYSLAFNPAGTRLAVGLAGNIMPIVDTLSGKTMMTLQGEEAIHGVWSPDGKSILTSGGCEQVLIWDATTGQVTRTILPVKCNNATPDFVDAVWSGDEKRIYVSSVAGFVLAYNTSTLQPLAGYEPHPPPSAWTTKVVSSPTQPLFALEDGLSVAIMDGNTGKMVKELTAKDKQTPFNYIFWSRDGRRLLADEYLWDVESGQLLKKLNITALAWLSNNDTVIGFASPQTLTTLSINDGHTIFALPGFGALNEAAAPGWDGNDLLTFDGGIETRWNPLNGNIIEQHSAAQPDWLSVNYAIVSHDGRFVATPNIIKDFKTGNEIVQLHDASQRDIVGWSYDGKRLVSGSSIYPNHIVVWSSQNGDVLFHLDTNSNNQNPYLGALAWSPNGKWIAASGSLMNPGDGSDNGFIALWDSQTGQSVALLTAGMKAERIQAMAWSPDNRWLAAGGGGTIYLWDMESQTPAAVLIGHTDQVLGLSWPPEGNLLASTALDGTVLIWKIP